MFVIIPIIFSGCDSDLTPKKISELLFENLDEVIIEKNEGFQNLSSKEISLLKKTVSNGSQLSLLESNHMPDVESKEYFQIILIKTNRANVRLFYNYKNKYILVKRIQVRQKDIKKYDCQVKTFIQYLNGTYKFYPSQDIEKLVEKLKSHS
jgi:hypothetical protein